MISPDAPDQVLDALGDKFLQALVGAVGGAREDLDAMRKWRPGWFPPMSDRCLANLIHDRLWAHMLELEGDRSAVTLHESGATREIVAGQFRLRLKRHHLDDRVSNYPTQTALDFWIQQNDGVLPGLEEITLAAGYRWDKETKTIGAPVISYRDGQENVIWAMELLGGSAADATSAAGGGGPTPITWTAVAGPELPVIDVISVGDDTATGTEVGTDGS